MIFSIAILVKVSNENTYFISCTNNYDHFGFLKEKQYEN